jgi:Holliday junction resolvase RusA-like endonuclease
MSLISYNNQKLSFSLPFPPFSINKYYYRNRQRTQEARLWGDAILSYLQSSDLQSAFSAFRESFDPKTMGLRLELKYGLPRALKKDGSINLRGSDLSNLEKTLIDLIFDKRHHDRGTPNLNLDDALILELHSYKYQSSSNEILVEIEVIQI